jgi:hypothetical protein
MGAFPTRPTIGLVVKQHDDVASLITTDYPCGKSPSVALPVSNAVLRQMIEAIMEHIAMLADTSG